MKKEFLQAIFNNAMQVRARYVGVRVETRGMSEPEYIINPYENIRQKLDYYNNAYTDDLALKSYDGIQITAVAQGDTPDDIMAFLEKRERGGTHDSNTGN